MRIHPVISQRIIVTGLWIMTGLTVGALLFVIGFILWRGLPHVTWAFLTQSPTDMGKGGGVFPLVVGTLLVAGLAVVVAGPIGVATAVYLTEYTRETQVTRVIRFGADCLAGIPSIIYGLFGCVFFVEILGMGYSVLAGSLTLAIMVLPTIIRTSEEAIRAVPKSYREVSYGLGSTRWQMVTRVVLRSALPGIATGIVLSIGRSVSETAAVMLTAGYGMNLPTSLLDSVRTLALHFYQLAKEGISMEKAYATAALLIISILLINTIAYWSMRRFVAKVR